MACGRGGTAIAEQLTAILNLEIQNFVNGLQQAAAQVQAFAQAIGNPLQNVSQAFAQQVQQINEVSTTAKQAAQSTVQAEKQAANDIGGAKKALYESINYQVKELNRFEKEAAQETVRVQKQAAQEVAAAKRAQYESINYQIKENLRFEKERAAAERLQTPAQDPNVLKNLQLLQSYQGVLQETTRRQQLFGALTSDLTSKTKLYNPVLLQNLQLLQGYQGVLKETGLAAEQTGSSFQNMSYVGRIALRSLIYGGIYLVITAIKDMFEAAEHVERLDAAFSTITGSLAGASQEMRSIKDIANATGRNFLALADGGLKLAEAGKAVGLTLEQSNRVLLAASSLAQRYGQDTQGTARYVDVFRSLLSKTTVTNSELVSAMSGVTGGLTLLETATGKSVRELRIFGDTAQSSVAIVGKMTDESIRAAKEGPKAATELKDAWTKLGNEITDLASKVGRGIKSMFTPVAGFVADTLAKVTRGAPSENLPSAMKRYQGDIYSASRRYGLDPAIMEGVVAVESSGDPRARSTTSTATGLMGITHGTAASFGTNPADLIDARINIETGAKILSNYTKQLESWAKENNVVVEDMVRLSLQAYHDGAGAVRGMLSQALKAGQPLTLESILPSVQRASGKEGVEYVGKILAIAGLPNVAKLSQAGIAETTLATGGAGLKTVDAHKANLEILADYKTKLEGVLADLDRQNKLTDGTMGTAQDKLTAVSSLVKDVLKFGANNNDVNKKDLEYFTQKEASLRDQVEAEKELDRLTKERAANLAKVLGGEKPSYAKTDLASIQAQEAGTRAQLSGATGTQADALKFLLDDLNVRKQKALGEVPDAMRRELHAIDEALTKATEDFGKLDDQPGHLAANLDEAQVSLKELQKRFQDLAQDKPAALALDPGKVSEFAQALEGLKGTFESVAAGGADLGDMTPKMREGFAELATEAGNLLQVLAQNATNNVALAQSMPEVIRLLGQMAAGMNAAETAAKKFADDQAFIQASLAKLAGKETKTRVDDYKAQTDAVIVELRKRGATELEIQQATDSQLKGMQRIQEEEQEKLIKEQEKPWRELGNQIESVLSSAFENILKGSKNIFEGIRDAFLKLLSQLAAEALAHQVIIPVLMGLLGGGNGESGSGGGGFAGFGAAAGLAGTALGGGESLGGSEGGGNVLGTALSVAKSGYGVYSGASGQSLLGGNAVLGNIMDTPIGSIGASYPGEATGISNLMDSFGLEATTIGEVAGAAGAGIAVGQLSSMLLSKLGLHGMGNTTLSGALGGAAAGTIILPGIGTAIGAAIGAIGGAIAGLFTNKKVPQPEFRPQGVQPASVGYSEDLGLYRTGAFGIMQPKIKDVGQAAQWVPVFNAINSSLNDMADQMLALFQGISPKLQKALVQPLAGAFLNIAAQIDTLDIKGKDLPDFYKKIQEMAEKTIPDMFTTAANTVIKQLESAVKKLDPVIKKFEDVIGKLQGDIDSLRSQQDALKVSLGKQILSLKEAFYSPAQSFLSRQADFEALKSAYGASNAMGKAQLAPQLGEAANQLLQMARSGDVLGQDPQLLRQLQNDLIGTLTDVQSSSGQVFDTLAGAVQEQIDAANKQIDILTGSLSNLDSIDGTIQQVLPVLQQMQDAVKTPANSDATLALAQQQLDVLKSIDAHLGGTAPAAPQFQSGTRYIHQNALSFLHRGEVVIPSHDAHMGTGGSITVNINTGNKSASDIAEEVVQQIERRTGRLQKNNLYVMPRR